jgi:hypothetical protein
MEAEAGRLANEEGVGEVSAGVGKGDVSNSTTSTFESEDVRDDGSSIWALNPSLGESGGGWSSSSSVICWDGSSCSGSSSSSSSVSSCTGMGVSGTTAKRV